MQLAGIDADLVNPDELALHHDLAVLEEQLDDFPQVSVELVQGFALTVGAGEPGHPTDVQSGVGVAFDDRDVGLHAKPQRSSAGVP